MRNASTSEVITRVTIRPSTMLAAALLAGALTGVALSMLIGLGWLGGLRAVRDFVAKRTTSVSASLRRTARRVVTAGAD